MSNENQTNKVKHSNVIKNMSGQGSNYPAPTAVAKKFNWGAFFLTWIWGLGNNTYITFLIFASYLLCLIPIVGGFAPLGVCIWFGIKGNEWAWQNKHFNSINHFHENQKKWAIASIIIGILGFIPIILVMVFIIPLLMKNPSM